MHLVAELETLVASHRTCGRLTGDTTAPTADGYLLWIAFSCGGRFERWVAPEAAKYDLLRSPFLISNN